MNVFVHIWEMIEPEGEALIIIEWEMIKTDIIRSIVDVPGQEEVVSPY